MKASRITAILVLIFIVLLTYAEAQEKKGGNFLKKMYLGVGFEFSSLNNSDEFSKLTGNGGIMVSIAYNVKPRIQLDVKYVYNNFITFNYLSESRYSQYDSYWHEIFDDFKSHYVSLKLNYYLSQNLDENPLYVTGGISVAVQPVYLNDFVNYNHYDSLSHYYVNVHSFDNVGHHIRILVGPEAGVGMFLAFGRVNFQSEFTFSARFSPFVDRSYRELSFNLINGLVYKF